MKIHKLNSSVSPFGGISFANHSFNKSGISQLIDNELGRRVRTSGFDYSEILRNLSNVFLSGGGVIEDIIAMILPAYRRPTSIYLPPATG